jgi:hypothetical protein
MSKKYIRPIVEISTDDKKCGSDCPFLQFIGRDNTHRTLFGYGLEHSPKGFSRCGNCLNCEVI